MGSYASLSSSISLLNRVVRVGDALAFSTRTIWLLCLGHAALPSTERVDYSYSLLLLYLYVLYHLYVPTIFAWRRPSYSSASDEYPLHNKRQVFLRGRIPSPNHQAKFRPLDESPLHNKRQVFVRGRIPSPNHEASFRPFWTNTLSKTWGKYSSRGRIPSPKDGGSIIRPLDEYPLQHMGQVFVLWTNILCSTWGKYSYYGRIPPPVLARGRIVPIGRMELSGSGQIYWYSCGVCNYYVQQLLIVRTTVDERQMCYCFV